MPVFIFFFFFLEMKYGDQMTVGLHQNPVFLSVSFWILVSSLNLRRLETEDKKTKETLVNDMVMMVVSYETKTVTTWKFPIRSFRVFVDRMRLSFDRRIYSGP